MMKLSRLLQQSRNSLELHSLKFSAGVSTAARKDALTVPKIFAPYYIFKAKASLSISPSMPTFSKTDAGHLKVTRHGNVMLAFVPAIGDKKYDTEKRQIFALSATEVGSLISLGPKESCEFFHDPGMQSSNAGQVRKSLSVKPPPDGIGYFISLNVANNILKTNERFTVHVTPAEFAVVKTACSFVLPHIMGWDRIISQRPDHSLTEKIPTLEWEK